MNNSPVSNPTVLDIKQEEPMEENDYDEELEEELDSSFHATALKESSDESYDEEGYETDEYFDEQGRKVVEIDYGKVPCVTPAAPEIRTKAYTKAELNPTVRDPRCTSTKTNLACFWPVYVGNFKDGDVAKFFASKGLHARWWFRRQDTYYMMFQRKAWLYDMLVYFVSEEDANLAIKLCHRATHRGYTLNVFPGREPVYFPEDRSLYAQKMKSGRIYSEQFFEKHVKYVCQVQVTCAVKFSMEYGAMEFKTPSDAKKAQQKERLFKFLPVEGKLQKQRFIEQDVLSEIETAIQAENPSPLEIRAEERNLKLLMRGIRPSYDGSIKYRVVPLRRGPSKSTQQNRWVKKMKRKYGKDGF